MALSARPTVATDTSATRSRCSSRQSSSRVQVGRQTLPVATGTPVSALLPREVDGALVVAGLLGQKPVSLSTPVFLDTALAPLTIQSQEGRQIYANSLGLVLLDRSQLASRTEAMLMVAEAADAFKEALKVNDAKEYWHKRATILENLALALKLQASLLGGSDRARHLAEARRVTEQALRIYQDIGYTESAERLAKTIEGMAEVPM